MIGVPLRIKRTYTEIVLVLAVSLAVGIVGVKVFTLLELLR